MKEMKTMERSLPVKLTESEMLERGSALASVVEDIDLETEDQKEQRQGMKSRMTELESRRARLASILRRGQENRHVACTQYLTDTQHVVVIRDDSGEELESRMAYEEELQGDLLEGGV